MNIIYHTTLSKNPLLCLVGIFLTFHGEDALTLWAAVLELDLPSLGPPEVCRHVDSEVIKLEVYGFKSGRQ